MRDYESANSISKYLRCPYKYKLCYVDNLEPKQTLSQFRGELIHNVISRIVSGEGDVTSYISDTVSSNSDQYIWNNGKRFTGKRTPDEMITHLTSNIPVFEKVASRYSDYANEATITYCINDQPITCRLDFVNGNRIVDIKTAVLIGDYSTITLSWKYNIQNILYSIVRYKTYSCSEIVYTNELIKANRKMSIVSVENVYIEKELNDIHSYFERVLMEMAGSHKFSNWPCNYVSCASPMGLCDYWNICHTLFEYEF